MSARELSQLLAPAPIETTATTVAQDPPAQGTTEPATTPFGSSIWFPMLLILAVLWFVMIGPERKNRKKREAMLTALKKGDRVMTTSGIYGTVVQMQGSVATLTIADGVRVRFSLQAIQGLEEERVEAKPTPAPGTAKEPS